LAIAREYLGKMKKNQVDTLILGCTHYPLLKPIIKQAMGNGVVLIDSAKEVAWEVKQLLEYTGKNRSATRKGRYRFLVSDEPKHFSQLAKRFLGFAVGNVERSPNV
jgi:glutamate racemase